MDNLNDFLRVGIIQTTLDNKLAWNDDPNKKITMNHYDAERLWEEVKDGFITIFNLPVNQRPQLIVLPELSIPSYREKDLDDLCKKAAAVVIGGIDFKEKERNVENKAVVKVPSNWPEQRFSRFVSTFYFGKNFFSELEKEYFKKKEVTGKSYPYIPILDAGEFGNIGVAICADFFDIERFLLYKGRIHHMIVIAYNKDVKSFYFLAEAISRLVYCNVIICNTGYYGGSISFSPYKKEYKRYIYKHEGSKLFTTQIINLPVNELDRAQSNDSEKNDSFKTPPPGYEKKGIYGL